MSTTFDVQADTHIVVGLVDLEAHADVESLAATLATSGWRRERVVLATERALGLGLVFRDCRGGLQLAPARPGPH